MAKTLVIAEKPSVAGDLTKALGRLPGMSKFEKEKDYFENDSLIISSAIGHLVELETPKQKWNFESLPILPEAFSLAPIEKTKDRLNVLKRLMKRTDVAEVINACDAGREGELIFHYVREVCGVKKPVKRLWMQSMTTQAIQDAYQNLRDEQQMKPLADAAQCRSESDWLVGINGTRAMTAYNSRNGGFRKTPVGRVQTPTLTILVEREKQIQAFVSRTYFEVFADFAAAAGQYRGRWFDPGFKKDSEDGHLKAERIWERAIADAIKERCDGKPGIVEEKSKPTSQAPPLLYDLTSLQREASNRFGFSARNSLGIAQSLYEGHKALTYPRTDSRFLPEDYVGEVMKIMTKFRDLGLNRDDAFPDDLPAFAGEALAKNMVHPNKRIFDNKKVSDHFAIIPTGQIPKTLKEQEAKIYDMVVRRFIAVFFPVAQFLVTQRITKVGEDLFKTDGKVLQVPGWLAVYGKDAGAVSGNKDGELVPVTEGEVVQTKAIEVEENQTKPPPRYTEATLLSAMETAGKLVEDEELREAMSEKGLGTPATRAAIIEGLIMDQYVLREQRELVPTQQGIRLVDTLNEIGVDVLCSPEMTGNWEFKLKQMEQGRLDRPSFMREIRGLTQGLTEKARQHAASASQRTYPDLPVACPACGTKPLKQDDRTFKCAAPDCEFALWKVVANRELQPHEAIELLSNGTVGPLSGFRSRLGRQFDATLKLTSELKIDFLNDKEDAEAEQAAIQPENYVCDYPPSGTKGGKIYEAPKAYVLDIAVRGDAEFKKVRLAKELCKFAIPREQAAKFFSLGRTDVIEKFISKKGRPFKASLVMDPAGKRFVNFEFPPREAAPKKAAAKKKAVSKPTE